MAITKEDTMEILVEAVEASDMLQSLITEIKALYVAQVPASEWHNFAQRVAFLTGGTAPASRIRLTTMRARWKTLEDSKQRQAVSRRVKGNLADEAFLAKRSNILDQMNDMSNLISMEGYSELYPEQRLAVADSLAYQDLDQTTLSKFIIGAIQKLTKKNPPEEIPKEISKEKFVPKAAKAYKVSHQSQAEAETIAALWRASDENGDRLASVIKNSAGDWECLAFDSGQEIGPITLEYAQAIPKRMKVKRRFGTPQ